MKDTILIIGASGQIGTELVITLRKIYGDANVIATDIRPMANEELSTGPFEVLDIMDQNRLFDIVKKYKVNQVYLLAALLSATAEKNIELGWSLNMRSLSHVLDLAKEKHIKKVYWPSSIAVFGPTTPSVLTPQYTIMEPNTVYGISKLAGERWCEYYHEKFGVDVRSIRYPGLIGWKSEPGGGTTDYAVHIFHEALKNGEYTCFLSEKTTLPMMHMNDAIRATMEIMEAPSENVKIRSSYNVAGLSFSPQELASEIQKHISEFKINYQSDYRQDIADSWPKSIDDSEAKTDWNWKSSFNLQGLTTDMLTNIKTLVNQ
ncbi:MAG: NAD-dependent epimerase/dehydratase family protein [Flavobacteriales bacterium]|nr:NAD-dependent epimerase/dehydratase family protein [Flavobacteriales bacterium]MBL6872343.1 NAD-dependent epimerase/dehydratase family protein [Flavobacteriales bacterium]